ncbi:MAG TPA: hypothetical protein VHT28_16535, partial [Silvibacterium sp.]|nr:hypothetical protein [Silvibacterium sp.]
VLDETMGDEVKITVIATGFRQEMPGRRERMLSAALNSHALHAPITPRIDFTAPPIMPRFASEEAEEPVFISAAASAVRRENVEVPAFAEPIASESVYEGPGDREPVYHHASNIIASAAAESFEEPVAVAVAEPVAQPEVFIEHGHNRNNEENLDIPAFLRRGAL